MRRSTKEQLRKIASHGSSGDDPSVELGIDFGTTRTVVACSDRGNHPVVGFMDPSGDSVGWIPSVVAERDGELRFGFDALGVSDDSSFSTRRSFKRLLSGPDSGMRQSVRIGSTVIGVGDLVTRFLTTVRTEIFARSDIRDSLGSDSAPLRAAVAVPANALGGQRFLTLDSFRRAGFEVTAMLNEPSAAGFEYTHRHRDTLSVKRDLVVVYDLGGGTFDASVVRMSGRRHEVLATAGVSQLGGDDFDVALADVVLSHVKLRLSDLPVRSRDRLLDQCRSAKESLNPSSRKITVDLEAVLGKDSPKPEVIIPVAEFYDACTPLVERSIEAMVPIMSRVDAVADDMDVDATLASDIAGIYVVGGASELPIVARALRQRFGRRVHRSPYPSAAVAIGLSIAADVEAGFVLIDRYARTFGVFREASSGRAITFDSIFTPEVELPSSGGNPHRCRREYRAAHNLGHFRFFECSALDAGGQPRGDMSLFGDVYFPFDPRLRANADLANIPVERCADDRGPRIVEEYSLDSHGIVDVRICNIDSGYERSFRLG